MRVSKTPTLWAVNAVEGGSWLACDSGVTVAAVFPEPTQSQASQLPHWFIGVWPIWLIVTLK
ncbi:hypothetical protein [Pseudomonas synxantha]|nr:hypothetical protein [Pseudomonas synxantha]